MVGCRTPFDLPATLVVSGLDDPTGTEDSDGTFGTMSITFPQAMNTSIVPVDTELPSTWNGSPISVGDYDSVTWLNSTTLKIEFDGSGFTSPAVLTYNPGATPIETATGDPYGSWTINLTHV